MSQLWLEKAEGSRRVQEPLIIPWRKTNVLANMPPVCRPKDGHLRLLQQQIDAQAELHAMWKDGGHALSQLQRHRKGLRRPAALIRSRNFALLGIRPFHGGARQSSG